MKPLIDALKHTALTVVELKGVNHVLRDDPERQHRQPRPRTVAAFSTACHGARRVCRAIALLCAAMTDDKMLARIAALLRQAEGTDNQHEADAFMAAAQRLATATSIDLAVARAHSDQRTKAQTPVQRTITIGNAGARGLRTYVQLFTRDRPRQRREVRRRVELDVRLRLRLRRGHRRQPRAVRQPGDADGAGVGGLHLDAGSTGRRRRSPRGSTSSWPSAPASASDWSRRVSRRSEKPPGAATAVPAPLSRCGTRTSS